MEPEEALAFIDSVADGGLGAPDYSEAYSIVKEALRRVAELEHAMEAPRAFLEELVGGATDPEEWTFEDKFRYYRTEARVVLANLKP